MSLLPDQHLSGMFIESSVRAVETCLEAWSREPFVNLCGFQHRREQMPLASAWKFVEPRSPNPTRAFLIDVGPRWTGYFDNHLHQYWDGAALKQFCERLKTTTCFFSYDDRAESTQVGGGQFNFERWMDRRVSRSVTLYKESGWTFKADGEPLPFENLAMYQNKRKKDRISAELLRSYGTSLGLEFWNEREYGTDVVLFHWDNGNEDAPELARHMLSIVRQAGLGEPKSMRTGPSGDRAT